MIARRRLFATSPRHRPGAPRAARVERVERGDDGAILILALVFLIVTSLTVFTLANWAGNSLVQSEHFNASSTLSYATGAAVQMEAQVLRYTYQAGTGGDFEQCTPGSGYALPSTSTSISVGEDSAAVSVYCSITDAPGTSATRVITFDACSSTDPEADCVSSPFLQATFSYDDYTTSNAFGCSSVSDEVTCGSGMAITGWDVV